MKRITVLLMVVAVLFVVPMQVFGMEVETEEEETEIVKSDYSFFRAVSVGGAFVGIASGIVTVITGVIVRTSKQPTYDDVGEMNNLSRNVMTIAFTTSALSAFIDMLSDH